VTDLLKIVEVQLFAKAEFDEYVAVHKTRMLLAITRVLALIADSPSGIILEVGGRSLISELMAEVLPEHTFLNTQGDLRYTQPSLASETIDLIINCEVYEHIKDPDMPDPNLANARDLELLTTFNGLGAKTFLSECFRALKPGGVMYFTTPNPASVTGIYYAITGEAANIYRPHVREYSIRECLTNLKEVGFEIINYETDICWKTPVRDNPTLCAKVAGILQNFGRRILDHGEDIAIVVKKPHTPR
jgi:SAM-dependent methyltransferase